ncbi:MAG: ABC transporter permease [Chitinophagaceae bacterium]|nr:ABC transporter permease [Chitinophagaceae bacterium]MCW5926722.1 ABC transporter permease [Chitinophagaceae bacterium]
MLKNLLLVAIRNFRRDKWYNLLNILGLMIGITFSLFLIFYIKDELSYDRHHEKADRIYRVNSHIKEADKDTMHWAITPYPLAPALSKDYPEIEEAVRFVGNGRTMLRNGDLRFYEENIFFADSNLFKVFTHPFIEGDPQTALQEPGSLVLTQSLAEKYFGKNAVYTAKTLQNAQGEIYKVTGVIKDVPKNSHIIFSAVVSTATLPPDFANSWGNFGFYTYVLLKPNVNTLSLNNKMEVLYDKYMASIFSQFNIKIRMNIQPVTDIHLHSTTTNEPEELGSMSYIYIFSVVALFMLLIACINYMNLTTARSARRAKEIGVRKVTGSSKLQLVAQFLVESIFTAFIALVFSIGLIALFLPMFNTLSGKSISFGTLLEPGTFFILLAVVIFVGLTGGSYPAFYLSKFNPVNILKGNLSKSSGNITLRRVLVVTQFSISMIMLICTWIVYGQLKYLREKDLGFSKEMVMSLQANANSDIRGKVATFRNEVKRDPQITSVSTSRNTPGSPSVNFNLYSIETDEGFKDKGIDNYAIDEYYIPTLDMKIMQGRNFSGLSDTLRSIIVNEMMVKEFGWGDKAIGRRVKFPGDTSSFFLEVVGVVRDFNQKALYNPIAPLLFFYRPNNNLIQLKLHTNDVPAVVQDVERSWKAALRDLPFQYTFLDQDFNSQYAADQKRGKIFTAFSVLTIMITCLGLLGLIAFITEQRQKEISIRKVMGANILQIIPLLTCNFVYLVALSCLIAFPVAYLFMDKWLEIFPYNTGITVAPFVLSAMVVLVITLGTVIFHSLRAAMANPVAALRTE